MPGEIGTHEQVQELLRRFVGRGGADEQKIDKPLHFREPVQGPGTLSVNIEAEGLRVLEEQTEPTRRRHPEATGPVRALAKMF